MARALATVQQIGRITPIYDKDGNEASRIETAFVMGWRVIVGKGEFSVGEKVVFLEADSVLPSELDWPHKFAPFLEKTNWRVKILTFNNMTGVYPSGTRYTAMSQGLVIPLMALEYAHLSASDLPLNNTYMFPDREIGLDVTAELGVTKHIGEAERDNQNGNPKGLFPSYIPKTDELRLQSHLHLQDDMAGRAYYISLKLDGSSVTMWRTADNVLHIASRNNERENTGNVYADAIKGQADKFPSGFAIQGEAVSVKIQGNPLGVKAPDFFAFNVYDFNRGAYLDYFEFIGFCEKYGIKTVPILELGLHYEHTLESLQEYSDRQRYPTDKPAEGIVIRPLIETVSSKGGRLSFKVINNLYKEPQ